MRVLPIRPHPSSDDPATTVGAALRRARDVDGLDLVQAAARADAALGCTIVDAAMFDLWERGLAPVTAVVFVAAVRALAGAEAAVILASLAS
jgi:hypothetical protein